MEHHANGGFSDNTPVGGHRYFYRVRVCRRRTTPRHVSEAYLDRVIRETERKE